MEGNPVHCFGADCKEYLELITANQWRSTIWVDDPTLPPRFGIVTTNMSESASSMFGEARNESWLEYSNAIVRTMMSRICSLQEKNCGRRVLWTRLQEFLNVDGKVVLASK
ncbi:hypothetical protein IV203_038270 [Nitzschia inconspicua]|uniref:Uncharacterized protein n=1 Tax=Nitzschia inconspicua TaxID=303405 RepID=A0A9K3PYW8_9STRA|nr:hypothetical protein IV203_038270 [Nitzschia inconspicua]